MLENNIKIPQIIALALQGISMVIAIICVLMQDQLLPTYLGINRSQHIAPLQFYIAILTFLLQAAFLIVILCYKGQNRRMLGALFAALYCLLSISTQALSVLSTMLFARFGGAETLAVHAALGSTISQSTFFFQSISTTLHMIAIGRYGISKAQKAGDYPL